MEMWVIVVNFHLSLIINSLIVKQLDQVKVEWSHAT
jgi:hypothetical protein